MLQLLAGLGFSAFVLAWLQPMHILPWVGWHSEILAFSGVFLFFVAVFGSCLKSSKVVAVPLGAALLALLLPVVAVQHYFGLVQFMGDAVVIALYAGGSVLALVTGYRATAPQHKHLSTTQTIPVVEWLAACTLFAATVSVMIALTQSFDVWPTFEWINRSEGYRRPGANFGQPNHLATLLLLGAASLLWMFHRRSVSWPFCFFLLTYLAFGLAITESRTGIVAAVVLTVWWMLLPNTKVNAQRFLGASALWLVFAIFVICWPGWIESVHSPGAAASAAASINLSAGSRLQIWPQLLDAALQKPWFGWGLREVSQAHNAVLHKYAVSEPFTYAHNVFLDALIGLGFPLACLLILAVATWGWKRIRAVDTPTGWYCIAYLLPVAVHSLFEFPFAYAYFLFPVMLVLGVLEAQSGTRPALRWPIWVLGVGFAATLGTAVWTVVEYVAAEEDFRVARFEAINWGKTPSDYVRPNLVLLTQLQTMLDASRTVPKAGMPPETIAMLRSAALRFPWTAIQNRYALSLALNGQPEEAARQLKVMRAMHGQKAYAALKTAWQEMARTEHPQLLQFEMP